jgi:ribose transport system permease protein
LTDVIQTDEGAPSVETTRKRRLPMSHLLEAYALVGLWIVVILFFSIWSKTSGTFTTSANFQALIGSQTVVAVVALAALVPLVANEWDLSVGANAGLASIFAASAMTSGTPLLLAILLGIGIAAGIGLANAIIVNRFGVNAVITTLGMATIIEGIINLKTHGLALNSNIPRSLTDFGSGLWLGIPQVTFALLVIVLFTYWLLEYTPFGRQLYALGSNPSAARLVGLRTKWILGSAFVTAGVLAGTAGILQVARAGGADPRVGPSFTLPALAAAFLSAAAIKPGRYNVGGALVALFFLATLNNGLSLAGAPVYIASFVNGAALIVGVGLAAYLGRKRSGLVAS